MLPVALRKWMCHHPALAVSLGSLFGLGLAGGVNEVTVHLINKGVILDLPNPILPALAFIAVAASGFTVGTALGRSGLPVSRALKGLKFAPLVVVAVVVVLDAFDFVLEGGSSFAGDPSETAMGVTMLSLGLMAAQALGWGAAALVARRQIRRGKWEVTAVPGADLARRSRRDWIAAHPVWTMNLLTLGTSLVTVVAIMVVQHAAKEGQWLADSWPNLLWIGIWAWPALAAAYAVTVGVILARRGESTQRTLVSMFWSPLTLGLPFALLSGCEFAIGTHRYSTADAAMMLMWAAVLASYSTITYYLAGQFLGWLVAAAYSRFVLRRRRRAALPNTP